MSQSALNGWAPQTLFQHLAEQQALKSVPPAAHGWLSLEDRLPVIILCIINFCREGRNWFDSKRLSCSRRD